MERGASESEDEVIGSKDIFDVFICCILLSSPLPLYTHTHTAVRGFLARCRYQKLQLHREEAALTIQTGTLALCTRNN